MAYTSVRQPDGLLEGQDDEEALHPVAARSSRLGARGVVFTVGAALALAGGAAAVAASSRTRQPPADAATQPPPSMARLRPQGLSEALDGCSKLWGQCGGEGYTGPVCCEGDNLCTKKPLDDLASYMQCRPPPPPMCEDPVEGSPCHSKVMWDMTDGIHAHPDWYHGLTAESGFKEFQEYEFQENKAASQCNMPCAPGTCYFVFRFEGCDSINEWTCDQPDNSVAYKCCCEYFHSRSNMLPPANPNPALAHAISELLDEHPTLFCTALMMPAGYEVGLMQAQYAAGRLGLFACETFAVYTNATIQLSPPNEFPVIKTGLIEGSLTGVVGGEFHTVLNTKVFLKFWNKVLTNSDALAADWVVKLDPDTVFVPMRLKALLHTQKGPLAQAEPAKGFFLNNCHGGLHGPIEVLSKNALKTYAAGHATCEAGAPAKHGQEDWFLRDCFQELGILRVDAYNVLFEGTWACQERASSVDPFRPPCFAPQVAFHPFKTVQSWMHCHTETANNPWALPTEPMSAGPDASNERHG